MIVQELQSVQRRMEEARMNLDWAEMMDPESVIDAARRKFQVLVAEYEIIKARLERA